MPDPAATVHTTRAGYIAALVDAAEALVMTEIPHGGRTARMRARAIAEQQAREFVAPAVWEAALAGNAEMQAEFARQFLETARAGLAYAMEAQGWR